MNINDFKREFKQVNFVYLGDGIILFRKPLEIFDERQSRERGIVAVSSKKGRDAATAKYAGTYTFEKGNNFNASGLMKALSRAKISGKDYNDAVSAWLKKNQKKYGYKYSYTPAKR